MKLSAVLLREKLEEIVVSCHYGKDSDQLNLSRPAFFIEKSQLKSGHLYITQKEKLSDMHCIPNGCCIICIGEPSSEQYIGQGCTVIHIQEGLDIFDVFNILNTLFEQYDNWERQLLQCINEKTPIQRFVDISMSIFENQMYILDSTLRQLAKSKHDAFSNARDVIAEDMENLTRLYASAQSISNTDEATILWNDHLKLRVLTKALRSHNRFAIAITLIEANRQLRESDIVLLDYMSYYVLRAFDYGFTSTSEEESPVSLATVITQLLREEVIPIDKIKNAQSVFGWESEHSLCIIYVKTPRPEHSFTTRIYHCQQMERQFTSAIATASLGENYAVVVNISLSEKYNDSILRFIAVLKKFDFVCGISCEFNDLTKVASFYSQAKYAYYYGSTVAQSKTVYKFSEYGLQFMLSHSSDGQEPEYLFPAGLNEIISHDRIYGSSYLKTLITYCDYKFNATHTAEHLHIHRTTFLDRFSKIRDFLKVDFDSPSDRLHLLMSLELVKLKKP